MNRRGRGSFEEEKGKEKETGERRNVVVIAIGFAVFVGAQGAER
jgi:hypothetical protein